MYAFVSNEYRAVVKTQRQLDFLMSIYTYPQFRKVNNELEAKKFFNSCNRDFMKTGLNKYGRPNDIGFIKIEYFIDGKNIYVNVFTKNFGFIKLSDLPSNMVRIFTLMYLLKTLDSLNYQIYHQMLNKTHLMICLS